MPSASAKLEKQASQEVSDPFKQVLTMIDHKRRNLEKRKTKLDGYRTEQKNGKELKGEQLAAVAKYGEVCTTLEFAADLAKSVQTLSADHAKLQKKQLRKDQLERTQHELSRIRELLIIQDVMQNLGNDTVRADFLAGRDGAAQITQEELARLDELYPIVAPKRDDGAAFAQQVASAAEHLLHLMEGRNKELLDTTYTSMKELLQRINISGYFEKNAQKLAPEAVSQEVDCQEKATEVPLIDPAIIAKEEAAPANLPPQNMPPQQVEAQVMVPNLPVVPDAASYFTANVVAPVVNAPQYPALPQQVMAPVPVQLRQQQRPISEVIGQGNSSFNFLQESQLEMETPSPPNVDLAVMLQYPPGTIPPGRNPPAAPAASAVPQPEFHQTIPTQTFTNQSFSVVPQQGAIPVSTSPATAAHIPATYPQQPQVPVATPYMPSVDPPPPIPMPPRAMQEEQAKMMAQTSTTAAPVQPPSFAQATYSSQAQASKPQNYVTSAPPGFQPQQKVLPNMQPPPHMQQAPHQQPAKHQQLAQSQFQPIPSLEQAAEQERAEEQMTWADGGVEVDDFSGGRQGGYRGRGGRGGRGRGSGFSGRGRGQQNGGGRSGNYQNRGNQEGGERSYENGGSSQRDYNQREYGGNFKRGSGGGAPRDRDREGAPSRGGQGYRGGSGGPFRGNPSNRMRGGNNQGGPRPQQVKQ